MLNPDKVGIRDKCQKPTGRGFLALSRQAFTHIRSLTSPASVDVTTLAERWLSSVIAIAPILLREFMKSCPRQPA
jgi:hypothetical protein